MQAVARRLRAAVRQYELVCRWGGDEIVVLLESVEENEATSAATRLEEAVEGSRITWDNTQIRVTMSGGVRWIERVDARTDPFQLVDRSDKGLYEAEHSDRGTLVRKREAV